jgi:hypothetical protein
MTLKQQIWEAHPYMPRLNKLKMAKYLPVGYSRLCAVSQLLGLPTPDKFCPKNSELSQEALTLRSSNGDLLCKFWIEPPNQNRIELPNGKALTEHDYYVLAGNQINTSGFIEGCGCTSCEGCRSAYLRDKADEISHALQKRVVPVGLPKDQRVNSTSPEVNERLPEVYRIPKPIPVIVGYVPLVTDGN